MVGIVSSSYYRVPGKVKKGNRPSKQTFNNKEGFVSQNAVVVAVKEILKYEFIDCGYRLMTSCLNRDSYTINHKKIYKIMKEEGLLKLDNRIERSVSERKFVKFRKVSSRPLECLEMDIKMVWIPRVEKRLSTLYDGCSYT